ncbi:hypothetical protein HBI31_076110 [Parastagonospora nodorum]|nr:hypothetical protein HBI31_076110 [Parastagonospora nodorum]
MTTAAEWLFLRHRTIDLQASIELLWPNLETRPYHIERAVLNEAKGILLEILSTCDEWQNSKSHDSRFTNIVGQDDVMASCQAELSNRVRGLENELALQYEILYPVESVDESQYEVAPVLQKLRYSGEPEAPIGSGHDPKAHVTSIGPKDTERDGKVELDPTQALETEIAVWFRGIPAAASTVQISGILDTTSEKNLIAQRTAFKEHIWTTDQEHKIEKPQSFRGRRGVRFDAKSKVSLTWCPEGSEKWVTSEFFIVDSDEPVAVFGREFVDFQGIFHDLDMSISPFRLPWIKSTRAQKQERQKRDEEIRQDNLELHRKAQAADRLERQSQMSASLALSPLSATTTSAAGGSSVSSGTVTPAETAPTQGPMAIASVPRIVVQDEDPPPVESGSGV